MDYRIEGVLNVLIDNLDYTECKFLKLFVDKAHDKMGKYFNYKLTNFFNLLDFPLIKEDLNKKCIDSVLSKLLVNINFDKILDIKWKKMFTFWVDIGLNKINIQLYAEFIEILKHIKNTLLYDLLEIRLAMLYLKNSEDFKKRFKGLHR